MDRNTNYCKTCTNKKTPICNCCLSVKTPSGNNKPPSMYVGYDEIIYPEAASKRADLSVLIEARAKRMQPIPVEWVIEYNQTISALSEK